MKKTILFIFTILPALLFAQETKKITEDHENPPYKEVYYVLKTDNSIKQGNYQQLGYKNSVITNGYYKNGLKDSLWTEYRRGGRVKISEGMYSLDKRTGVWEFFDYSGETEQKYDYTKNEIVYFKPEENDKEYRVIKGIDTITTKLDRPPLYIGGSTMMFEPIIRTIKYPLSAKENGISGKVYIAFTIDNSGKTSDHRVIEGIGYGCDEEALRVVRDIPDNWFPGILNGHTVDVEYVLPISFSLQ